jgi:hypothetical protein
LGFFSPVDPSPIPASSNCTAKFRSVQNDVVDNRLNYTFLLLNGCINRDANEVRWNDMVYAIDEYITAKGEQIVP